jgi:vacuolar-type H+-ATPase subunit E/Vma4
MSDSTVVEKAASAVAASTGQDIAQTAEQEVKNILTDIKTEAENIVADAKADAVKVEEKLEPEVVKVEADAETVKLDTENALHRAWANVVWLEQTVQHFVVEGWKNDVVTKLESLKADITGHAAAAGTPVPTNPSTK